MVQTPHIESPSAEATRLHFRFSRGAGAGLPLDFSVQGAGEESCLLGTCARGLSQSRPGHPLACPGLQALSRPGPSSARCTAHWDLRLLLSFRIVITRPGASCLPNPC